MIKITKQNWWIWLAALGLTMFLLSGLGRAIYCKGLESSEAAGWMQALGAIAAIIGAFLIVQIQHQSERELDAERRRLADVAQQGRELSERVLALRNAIEVTAQAIEAMRNSVDNARYPNRTFAVDQYMSRLEPISKILDSFVTPNASHIAVLAALNMSLSITAVLGDLRRVGGAMTEQLLARCEKRIEEAEQTLMNLKNLNLELQIEINQLRQFQ